MKVLLIGGTGLIGRPVLRELIARGHDVTVMARRPEVLNDVFGHLRVVSGDAFVRRDVARAAACTDVITGSV